MNEQRKWVLLSTHLCGYSNIKKPFAENSANGYIWRTGRDSNPLLTPMKEACFKAIIFIPCDSHVTVSELWQYRQ